VRVHLVSMGLDRTVVSCCLHYFGTDSSWECPLDASDPCCLNTAHGWFAHPKWWCSWLKADDATWTQVGLKVVEVELCNCQREVVLEC